LEVIADYCSNFIHVAFLSHRMEAYGQRTLFTIGSLKSS